VLQFIDAGNDMIFDGFGESDVVRGQDQFHKATVR
jgi:hypothetical protein